MGAAAAPSQKKRFPAMQLDRTRLALIADWEAVAVAASLPWSTSATSILLVGWLLTLIATLDVAMLRREVMTAAGGLPILLWLLAVLGVLWAGVNWAERLAGLEGFQRLLAIPLLLAQFRRSKKGMCVVYGFFISCLLLLAASWAVLLGPAWLNPHQVRGIPVKDAISQSTVCLICACALIWRVCDLLRARAWWPALGFAGLAHLFIANVLFVAMSRADVAVAAVLALLLGWRQFRWKGIITACVAGGVLAAVGWTSSSYLQLRVTSAIEDVQTYRATGAGTDIGDHIEFFGKSLSFVRDAPLFGHGTGSISDQFRRSAIGKTGAAGVVSANPHNQILAVAIQLGLLGAGLLLVMWLAHYLLFRAMGLASWIGTVVVVQNVVSSLTSSHLFDFMQGWLYVFGVGVIGGMVLRDASPALTPAATSGD
jgi:hypothetical protein